ncbi:hypothetical protein BDZ45DRAFT_132301 [Acephala macrosclerotiorum]|nr:hypothetical protein BDZ45DRAFT_132301 [Acephala macrosclerotiorum]
MMCCFAEGLLHIISPGFPFLPARGRLFASVRSMYVLICCILHPHNPTVAGATLVVLPISGSVPRLCCASYPLGVCALFPFGYMSFLLFGVCFVALGFCYVCCVSNRLGL